MNFTKAAMIIIAFVGCTSQKQTPQPTPVAVADQPKIEMNVVREYESLKSTPIPIGDKDKWATSSILGWSTFTMDFPDDDHVAKQFADRFALRKCKFTEALREDIEATAEQWLHSHKGTDDIVIKKHGLEIAVGGYREPGLIRMNLAFTIDHK